MKKIIISTSIVLQTLISISVIGQYIFDGTYYISNSENQPVYHLNHLQTFPWIEGDSAGIDKGFKKSNFGIKAGLRFPNDETNEIFGSGIIWGFDMLFWGKKDNGFKLTLDIMHDKGKEKQIIQDSTALFNIRSEFENKFFGASLSGSFIHKFRNVDYVIPYVGLGLSLNYYEYSMDGYLETTTCAVYYYEEDEYSREKFYDMDNFGAIGLQPVAGAKMKKLPFYVEMKYLGIITVFAGNEDYDNQGILAITGGLMF